MMSYKKNQETDQGLYQRIMDYKVKWDSFAECQLNKVNSFRDYVYDTEEEESEISFVNDSKSQSKVTISQLRTVCNRIKSDLRDLSPQLQAVPKKPEKDEHSRKIYQSILEQKILNNYNLCQLYDAFDSIIDKSYCIVKACVKSKFDPSSEKVVKDLYFENVPDIKNVFFDCNVDFNKINKEGDFVGYCKIIDTDNASSEWVEFWQKEYKTTVYGERLDPITNKEITEPVQKNANYIFKHSPIREVEYVKHCVFKDGELVLEEKWPFDLLPFIVGSGVSFDNYGDRLEKRLNLVPFAEHLQNAQKLLDYSATVQFHNLKMSRGSSKYMIPIGAIDGKEKDWQNRNVEDKDLLYHPTILGRNGETIQVQPQPINDVPQSPVVSEALETYPQLINSLLGVNLEKDITYNTSGEAIRKMEMIRAKNAKLYTSKFINLLDCIGSLVSHYIPKIFDRPQYITVANEGKSSVIGVNMQDQNIKTINLKDMDSAYDICVSAGQSQSSSQEATKIALEQLYSIAGALGPEAPQVVMNTIDLYASSLDTVESSEISKRLSLMVPASIRKLSEGEVTVDQLDMQQQQAQQQQAQQQQQEQQFQKQIVEAQAKAELEKAQADITSAHAKILDSENKVKSSAIKANAEVAKTLSDGDKK